MKLVRQILMTSTVAVALGMTACGGSDESAVSATGKFIRGPITAFGSVYVNGARYDTSNATVYVDDEPAGESELRVGMTVIMKESSPGVAGSIHYDSDVEGVVISNSVVTDGTGQMNVMGQTVTLTSSTIFESKVAGIASASDVVAGNVVEVTGSPSGEGSFTATRFEVKAETVSAYLATGEHLEVKGVVAGHDGSSSFIIGGMTIVYSGSTDTSDMPAGNWDGLFVEAKSNVELDASNQMVASKVEPEYHDMHGDDNDEVEVEGAVSALTDASITVNGVEFQRDASTQYDLTGQTLAVGLMVEVEGHFNNDGQLLAEEVEFEDGEAGSEVYGMVDAIDMTDTNAGTVTVDGVVYSVTNSTIMHDDSHMVNNFNLSMLNTGDTVEIHVDVTNTVIKLERK